MAFDTFAKVLRCPVYTNPYFGVYPSNRRNEPKLLPLNSYNRENNFDLFFRLVPNSRFTEKVNHMIISFAFSLCNMLFFTPPYLLSYQRYSSEIYRQNVFLVFVHLTTLISVHI